jgi:hypothetical protein
MAMGTEMVGVKMDKIIVNGLDDKKSKLNIGLNMSTNDKLVHQIREQISMAGIQVKQRMQLIQAELLEELNDGDGKGIDLH